ncbi:MAG TPA: MATE family efflux transporter [Candidatus Desulfovibrio intestinipullorum]|uniref:MATE family efflux transporter n=1 Tax=Candidatus Desulfovibrio intestinipullorum TaxID=2838536 RepID=A0A9D1PVI9_9BACT|nr:MATE family efflux transporter [Candidatus Desulfovibrio intestinipullorum]
MQLSTVLRRHLGSMLLLAGPILVSQYAYLASGMADTVMSGMLGTVFQAGVAVGAAVWVPVQMFVTGVLYGVMILVSQHFGADRQDDIAGAARQGLWLALGLGAAASGLLYLLAPHLTLFGVTEDVAQKAEDYLQALAWGLPFSSMAISIRFYCDGQKNVVPATVIAILVVLVNIVLNYGLMFGHFGLPAMDVTGCGLATGISMALSFVLFVVYVHKTPRYAGLRLLARLAAPAGRQIGELVRVGLPIGIAMVSEFLVLSVIALCISTSGATAIAAHQIAYNFMMILFAIPTSLAMATSIMVGNARGSGSKRAERGVVITSVCTGFVVGGLLTVLMWVGAGPVAELYSHDRAVIVLASRLLLIAAFFQLVDAVQICLNGSLRGIEDTVVPFLITSGIYWLVALPLGYVLSDMPLPFGLRESFPGYGVAGWWTALVLGISLVALALAVRVRKLFFTGPLEDCEEEGREEDKARADGSTDSALAASATDTGTEHAETTLAESASETVLDARAQARGRGRLRGLFARMGGTLRRHPKKGIAFAVLLVLILFSSSSEESGTVRVHSTDLVARSTLRQEFPVTGIIKPEEGAEVKTGSRFTGVIDRLHVRLGDAVTKGQVIAELDNREQEAECNRLNATIRKLKAELDMAKKTYPLQIRETEALLDSARAEHVYAQKKLRRVSSLHKASAVSRDEAERVRQEADVAAAAAQQQRTARERLEEEFTLRTIYLAEAIAEAEAELATANIRRSYATIVSPMDGVVSEITAQEGETLVAGLQVAYLVTVLDPSRLELQMFVDENDIGRVQPGTRVAFTVESFRDRVFEGHVDLIHPGPEIRNNIVYYRALVRLSPETALSLRPEMTARCTVIAGEKENVLCVPNAAFKWIQDRKVVFVEDGAGVHPVLVRTGMEGLTHTEVLSGLEEGQRVATSLELPTPLPEDWMQLLAEEAPREG